MPATSKYDQKRLQTQRDLSAKKRGGLKSPGAKLAQLLEWVNLVPPDVQLPFEELADSDFVPSEVVLEAITKLPPALQAHLLQLMNRPSEWPMRQEMLAERHLGWSSDRSEEAVRRNDELARVVVQNKAVRERYRLIVKARQFFYRFVAFRTALRTLGLTVPVPAELLIEVDGKRGAFVTHNDPFLSAILGQRLDYIRVCPICGRTFFAGRVNQDACPETCADALRQRRKRERVKSEQREKTEKLMAKKKALTKKAKKR